MENITLYNSGQTVRAVDSKQRPLPYLVAHPPTYYYRLVVVSSDSRDVCCMQCMHT